MRPLLLAFLATSLAASEADFTPLFDGRSLDGWWGCGTEDPAVWHAQSDAALARKKSGSLDQALHQLLTYWFGVFLLVVIAAGLICYGLFNFARARHLSQT